MFFVSVMAIGDKFHVLRYDRIQLPIQHDLHISLLSHVGRRVVPGSDGRLLLHVSLWGFSHDCILSVCLWYFKKCSK